MSETTSGDSQPEDGLGSNQHLIERIQKFDAFSILIISVVGYATLYRFQAGYLRFFNVPTQYIGFSLSAIVIAASIVVPYVILLVSLALFLYWLLLTWPPSWPPICSRWRKLTPNHVALLKKYIEVFFLLYLMIIALILLAFQRPDYSYLGASTLIVVCALLKLWLNSQSRHDSTSEEMPSDTFIAIKDKALSYWYVVLLLMLIAFMAIADMGGHMYALLKHEYQVANTTDEMIVVYGTAEHAVLSPFDRNCGIIDSKYTILMTEDFYGKLFHPEELGRMEVKPPQVSGTTNPAPTPCATATTTPPPP